MQTILLTGATGYLGSHLAKGFVSAGYQVAILKRTNSDLSRIESLLPGLQMFNTEDGLDLPFRSLGQVKAVVHAATCYGRDGEAASVVAETNTMFPLRLLDLSKANRVEAFINTDSFFSSERTYDYLANYSLSKRHFAEWGRRYAEDETSKFLNVRLEHVFGSGDSESKFVNWLIRQCSNSPEAISLTEGNQQRDFIFIDDVVAAFVVLMKNLSDLHSGWNSVGLGSGRPVSIKNFVEMVHRLTCSKSQLRFGDIPYRHGEIMHSCADISLLESLGWSPTVSLETAVKRMIAFEAGQTGGYGHGTYHCFQQD